MSATLLLLVGISFPASGQTPFTEVDAAAIRGFLDRTFATGPLGMESRFVTLTPEQKKRLARGHWAGGKPSENVNFQAQAAAGGLCSTARASTG